MEMKLVVLDVKDHPQAVEIPREVMDKAPKLYETTISPCHERRQLPKGVYSFSTTTLERIITKSGRYLFIFSLVSAKHQEVDDFFVHMKVTPSLKIGSRSICSHPGDCEENHNNQIPEAVRLRLGRVNPLNVYLTRVDGNPMEFEGIPSDIACSICTVEANEVAISPVISRDLLKIVNGKLILEVPITVHEGNLAPFRPTMRAVLKMSTADALVASFTISVLPGEVSSARIIDASEAPGNHLYPGQIIEELILDILNESQNPISSGMKVKVILDGFAFQNENGPERSVDENGRLDLGMQLRVTTGYGDSARLELHHTENTKESFASLLVMEFTTVKRSLRVRNVPEYVSIGSQVTGLVIEAIDENGEVDLTMSGNDHVLTLDWDRFVIVPLFEGRGTLQGITMPLQEGKWEGCISHGHYPNMKTKFKVKVMRRVKSEGAQDANLQLTTPSAGQFHDLSTSAVVDIHKRQDNLLCLDHKLTKHKAELERLHERQKQHEEARREYHG